MCALVAVLSTYKLIQPIIITFAYSGSEITIQLDNIHFIHRHIIIIICLWFYHIMLRLFINLKLELVLLKYVWVIHSRLLYRQVVEQASKTAMFFISERIVSSCWLQFCWTFSGKSYSVVCPLLCPCSQPRSPGCRESMWLGQGDTGHCIGDQLNYSFIAQEKRDVRGTQKHCCCRERRCDVMKNLLDQEG